MLTYFGRIPNQRVTVDIILTYFGLIPNQRVTVDIIFTYFGLIPNQRVTVDIILTYFGLIPNQIIQTKKGYYRYHINLLRSHSRPNYPKFFANFMVILTSQIFLILFIGSSHQNLFWNLSSQLQKFKKNMIHCFCAITYFSAHCISDKEVRTAVVRSV